MHETINCDEAIFNEDFSGEIVALTIYGAGIMVHWTIIYLAFYCGNKHVLLVIKQIFEPLS